MSEEQEPGVRRQNAEGRKLIAEGRWLTADRWWLKAGAIRPKNAMI
jgi:hypothetical protein